MAETQNIVLSSNMEKVCVLPDDIIEAILLRLRAEPLSRFKCVSKAWCKLIGDSRFKEEHLKHGGGKLKILFQIRTKIGYKFPTVDYDAFGEDVEMPGRDFDDMSMMHNSCRGLVLMQRSPRDGSVYVWNPTTGQRHLLPKPNASYEKDCSFDYGLGYDPIARVYKVLYDHYDENLNRVYWSLYKQCTNSWTELDNIPYRRSDSGKKFLENALHIFACPLTSDSYKAECILAFDISNETFREIPLPNYREILTGLPLPIHLSGNGELLVSDDTESRCLARYDSMTKNWKTFRPLNCNLRLIETHIYVESLVTFDIAENLDEENREIKGRFTKKRCFEVRDISTPCELNSLQQFN